MESKMRKNINNILILIFLFLLLSCSASLDREALENSLNSWLYSDKSELVKIWGPPSKIESDQNGGEIFIYDQSSKSQTQGMVWTNPKTGVTTYTKPEEQTTYLTIMMYVNPRGKIYHWRYDTNF